jgi:hypothetical protein
MQLTQRLFHVSEEAGIGVFAPRIPVRADLDQKTGLVWAITEACLPNFLTPRDCPRVTYHIGAQTAQADIARFFTPGHRHAVCIEGAWFARMRNTRLYAYEFDPSDFYLQDAAAGYYVSERAQTPVAVHAIPDLFQALFDRNVEVRIIGNLWALADAVVQSTLIYSNCRMRNAAPRP